MSEPTEGIDAVVSAIASGRVAIIPTDTVYGIAASLDSPGAIETIFELKQRDRAKALPVLGHSLDSFDAIGVFDERAATFARRFWPGPLTLVVPRATGFVVDLGGGEADARTIAVRVPASDVALEVLRRTGPLAVTSANLSGDPPATSLGDAREALGDRVAAWADGGPCEGDPSTIVSLVGQAKILRAGAIGDAALLHDAGGSSPASGNVSS